MNGEVWQEKLTVCTESAKWYRDLTHAETLLHHRKSVYQKVRSIIHTVAISYTKERKERANCVYARSSFVLIKFRLLSLKPSVKGSCQFSRFHSLLAIHCHFRPCHFFLAYYYNCVVTGSGWRVPISPPHWICKCIIALLQILYNSPTASRTNPNSVACQPRFGMNWPQPVSWLTPIPQVVPRLQPDAGNCISPRVTFFHACVLLHVPLFCQQHPFPASLYPVNSFKSELRWNLFWEAFLDPLSPRISRIGIPRTCSSLVQVLKLGL